jgi:hypothetical protein
MTYKQVQVYYCGIGCTTPLLSTGPSLCRYSTGHINQSKHVDETL